MAWTWRSSGVLDRPKPEEWHIPGLAGSTARCAALDGNVAKSEVAVANSLLTTSVGGRAGLFENPPTDVASTAFGLTAGDMFPRLGHYVTAACLPE